MRPCLYPSVETVESILQRAPPELTTAGRTETKPWWEEDRPEPSPIASAPKPKPADQDNVSRPPSTAVLLSEQSSEQTNLTVSDAATMRLVHKTYEDDKGYLVTTKVWEPSETIPAVREDCHQQSLSAQVSGDHGIYMNSKDCCRQSTDSGHTQTAVQEDCDQQSMWNCTAC